MDLLKEFKKEKEKEMIKLLLLKWLCDSNKWASKHMHEIGSLLGKEFSTLALPLKSSRAYELVKEWEEKGLIRVKDHTSKAKKYAFNTTLFANMVRKETCTIFLD